MIFIYPSEKAMTAQLLSAIVPERKRKTIIFGQADATQQYSNTADNIDQFKDVITGSEAVKYTVIN